MNIDEAIQQKIENTLTEGEYCSESKVKVVAKHLMEDYYDVFSNDLGETKRELERLTERQDRLWDIIHRVKEPKSVIIGRWFRKFLFWRKD